MDGFVVARLIQIVLSCVIFIILVYFLFYVEVMQLRLPLPMDLKPFQKQ